MIDKFTIKIKYNRQRTTVLHYFLLKFIYNLYNEDKEKQNYKFLSYLLIFIKFLYCSLKNSCSPKLRYSIHLVYNSNTFIDSTCQARAIQQVELINIDLTEIYQFKPRFDWTVNHMVTSSAGHMRWQIWTHQNTSKAKLAFSF